MKTRSHLPIKLVVVAFSLIGSLEMRSQGQAPAGWFIAGSKPAEYEMGSDFSTIHSGHAAAFIKSKQSTGPGFGTMMQTFKADSYVGKRVRFSAFLKTREVYGWSALWMRIDDSRQSKQPLGFDNMRNRAIIGTSDWQQYSIVIDVEQNASSVSIGALLNGGGSLWFDDAKFDVVDSSVAVTAVNEFIAPRPVIPDQPKNLDFER